MDTRNNLKKNIKVLKQFGRVLNKYKKTNSSNNYIKIDDLLSVISDLITVEKNKIRDNYSESGDDVELSSDRKHEKLMRTRSIVNECCVS